MRSRWWNRVPKSETFLETEEGKPEGKGGLGKFYRGKGVYFGGNFG